MVGNPVKNAIELRQQIKDFVDPLVAPTVGAFVGASTELIPPVLRPAQAAYRRLCDIHAATGLVGAALSSATLLDPACGQYLGADNPVFTASPPPFTGGQCVGVNYMVTNRLIRVNASGTVVQDLTSTIGPYQGPVQGIYKRTEVGQFAPAGNVNLFGNYLIVGPGQTYVQLDGSTDSQTIQQRTRTVVSVARQDGLPDTCGNPPGSGPGSYPRTRTTPPPAANFTYNNYGGPSVDISVGSPTLNARGEFSIPVSIGDISLDFGGGIPGGASDDGGLPVPQIGVPVPTTEDTVIDAPLGKRIIGAFVNVLSSPSRDTSIGLTNNRTLRVPRYGSLFFGDGGFYEGQYNVQLISQGIYTTSPTGASQIWSSPLAGVTWIVTPVYLNVE